MSELRAFIPLGFRHIADFEAMDHILFLLALAATYRARDWRNSLWVISAFTIGHSVTLGLAVTGAVALPAALVEFLIPLTIVATCVENLLVRDRAHAWWGGRYRPVFAGAFGGPSARPGRWCFIPCTPRSPSSVTTPGTAWR